jgi:hypothetical protein
VEIAMVRGLLFIVSVGMAAPVLAQSDPGAGEILIDATGPNAKHGESTRVPLPPEGPGRQAFLADFITVNPRENEVSSNGRSLSAFDFYNRVGRPDLAAQADEHTRQRIWLISGSVLTLAAGTAAGIIVINNAQNLNDPACFVNNNQSYNECVDRSKATTLHGSLIIGAGVVVAASLLTWAFLIPEMVTTPEETVHLATQYNRELSKKYGATGARLRIVPSLAPGYAGLTARVTF